MTPRSDARLDRVREFLTELREARARYSMAAEWPSFKDWYREVYRFLETECCGQWPDTMFTELRFNPATGRHGRPEWVGMHAHSIDTEKINAERRRTWDRASGAAEKLLGRMLEDPEVPWKRPYGMEPPKLERSGLPTAIYAGGDVLVNLGTIESSQIQQGSPGSSQVSQHQIETVLSDLLEFVGAAREATKDKEAVRDKISPVVNGLEDAARAQKPSLPTIKTLLQALGGLLTAGDHLSAITERIPMLIASIDKLIR